MKLKKGLTAVVCLSASLALADSLELKNGSLIKGEYMGGTQTEISFRVGSSIQRYPVSDIVSLRFEADSAPAPARPATSSPAPTPAPAKPATVAPAPQPTLAARNSSSVSSNPATRDHVTVPAGTRLMVRTIDAVDSDKNQIGDKFQASLEEPLVVNGTTIAPKGTIVYGRLEDAKSAGQLTGRSELRVSLTGIVLGGQTHPLVTGDYSLSGDSRTASTARRAGGGAALGALIGAIAGGGKGAAIGAGVGAGAGTAVQVMTKGEQVHIPSETLLEFTLDQPAYLPAPTSGK
jgi:hypothetical protein